MKMPKYALFAIIVFAGFAVSNLAAQVNQDELRQNLPSVVFINYEGPHARIDTREQIRQLGVVIGQQVSGRESGLAPTLANMSAEERRTFAYRFDIGALNRYFVIHSISEPENGKNDADIFGLGVDAGVDHVRNLRTIIQGYLQTAYDYSESDARLLAEFITIYNAVYRGNWDYFVSRYKTPVIGSITRERAGLSIRYDEWPGRTLLLIPLGIGGLSSIDTSVITDSRVIEELRRDDDQGVPQRQEMVGLMDREAQSAEQQAQAQRQAAEQEQARIAAERAQAQQQQQAIDQQRQTIQDDQSAGRISDEDAARAQADLDSQAAALAQRQDDLDSQAQAADQMASDAQALDDLAQQRSDAAQQMRQDIAADQQAAIAQPSADGVLGVTIERQDPPIGSLVRLDPANGTVLRKSALNLVHARTVTIVAGRLFSIAGENRAQGAVRLIEINQNTLEMIKQGDDDIMTGSLLWVNGNDLYSITVTLSNNTCFIGRFDTNLVLQAKSAVQVHPQASITIQQGRLITQRADGSAVLLNPQDLTEFK
jgi:multidrug efflux pump subunit AcrA (membrane-fusion protein)